MTTLLVFPPPLTVQLIFGLEALAIGVALWLAAPWVMRRRPGAAAYLAIGRTIALVAGIVLVVAAFLGEQTPYSDLKNPVADTVTSVQTGQALFMANCAACHGVDGRGGGPAAGTTAVRPANLRSGHLNSHTDGDIFYWISNGLPGGMPAWAERGLSDTDRWNLVNYLRSINGRGPTAPPVSPGSSAPAPANPSITPTASGAAFGTAGGTADPADMAGLLFAPGLGAILGGWFVAGARRSRRRR
jgi:mono/diheme cytochrome c family protein